MGSRTIEGEPQGKIERRPSGDKEVLEPYEGQVTTIPSLVRGNGSIAHTAQDKANLLAKLFAGKMCIPDPDKTPPTPSEIIKEKK